MKSHELLLRCKICGKLVPVGEMHYNANFQIICKDCYTRLYPSRTKPSRLSVERASKPSPKDWWFCNFCNYKFSTKKGKKPLSCPMCGRSIIEKADKMAEKLLKEAITYNEDFDTD